MRKVGLLMFVGALLAASGAFAQSAAAPPPAPSPEAVALTRRYLAAMQMDKSMRPMILSMTSGMVRQQAQRFPNLNEEQRARLSEAINTAIAESYGDGMLERMAEKMVPGMATVFSLEELKAMVDFYESPIGQSIVSKMPKLGETSSTAMIEMMPEIQADLEVRIRKNVEALKLGNE